ncbi:MULTISPECIES: carbohydrate kinase family protein [Cyanophyceae]|uniref:carbohydrate kinase family protein n=1 Tax=Cyanophyceae TaxID=3028117 RepID=UPI00232E3982|nr:MULTISPECIES: carbohydrate kinase [Cyanophyceae]MDB9321403.1 carbohydrate kinase [Nodularia spumigena CS-591/07A]MDB9329873.1 carbohydrate kinase [Nodularia spumigena CS-591/04]MDB9341084.1 carbohydrate kinase [Nodularia spumigena CS-589/07]MDB9347587.1 carbohydrate kinase [Nodularia spumigena CS-588/01]MDB9351726.1 carbohydrate kinase [Nodularia spumigena CS-588/05]
MSNPRVLCLGEILFDCLADQLGLTLEEVKSWTPYPGGAPANVACALVKLGTPAGFIGAVGEDEPGNELVKLLEEIGVDTTGVQRHSTAPTRQVYVVRDLAGDRNFAGFGEYDTSEFADTRLKAEQLPESLFQEAEFLVLGTLELAYPESEQAVHRALDLAEQYDLKIILDVNWRPVFWQDADIARQKIQEIWKRVDFLKLSKEEAEWLFDTTDPGAITYRMDTIDGVLVTDGEHGCTYCLGENEGHLPSYPIDVVDTTGAGDSFLAGFIHQLSIHGIQGLQDAETAKKVVAYANAVGALTTIKAGAIASQPTAAEIDAFLASHPV